MALWNSEPLILWPFVSVSCLSRRVHISSVTLEHLQGSYKVEPGDGQSRDSYLKEHGVVTFLVINPKVQSVMVLHVHIKSESPFLKIVQYAAKKTLQNLALPFQLRDFLLLFSCFHHQLLFKSPTGGFRGVLNWPSEDGKVPVVLEKSTNIRL